MQSGFCSNCGQPVPAGAAFCGNCGTPQKRANQQEPTQLTPPPAPGAETVQAEVQPGGDYAPTQLQPPPAPPGAMPEGSSLSDPYAAQYGVLPYPPSAGPVGPAGAYPPPPGAPPQVPPGPGYVSGPPPVVAPGGGVAPWAQAPKKRKGRWIFGCLAAVVVVLLACGGGSYLLISKLGSSSNGTAQHQSGTTPGTGAGTGSTPGSNTFNPQTLDNINRQAIYAGMTITIQSAQQIASVQGFYNNDPEHDAVLKIQGKVDNQTNRPSGVPIAAHLLDASGNMVDPNGGHGSPKDAFPGFVPPFNAITGAWYFEVPRNAKISDWTLLIGDGQEVQVAIPLTGSYDPKKWEPVKHQIGQTITYNDGNIKGTVTQVVTAVWEPGYQAPKGMRFLLMYLHVVNNTAFSIAVGDGTPPQYLLLFPNGDRHQPEVVYNTPINEVVEGGESKDVGYDTFLIPEEPAHYVLLFLNPDGSTAGQVDLGTI